MLIAFQVCNKDTAELLRLLEWCAKLDDYKHHDAVIVADRATSDAVLNCYKVASKMFRRTHFATNERPTVGWIEGPKSLFIATAKYAARHNQPFLLMETDCVPLRKGWLDDIDAEYRTCGRRYMGHVYECRQIGLPEKLMSGIGVYPPDAVELIPLLMSGANWDVAMTPAVVPNAHHTRLIHHLWGSMESPPIFAPQGIGKTHIYDLGIITDEMALWHRNKDGSLMQELARKWGWPHAAPEGTGRADYCSLRRAGDIINLLPLLRVKSRSMKRPMRLVVHREFAPILDGVSYVEPVIWDGDWEDPLAAAAKHHAVNLQVFGKNLRPDMHHGNFARIPWKAAGVAFKRHWPLIFDRRDPAREAALAGATFKTDKPKLLVKLDGHSSPFGERDWIRAKITESFPNAEIVNLDAVRAFRLYDLIGLMDRAHCLVTADTSTLWLSHASKVPSVQFVNGFGFSASPPRGNCIKRVAYQHSVHKWGQIHDAIKKALTITSHGDSMVLAFSDFTPTEAEAKGRQDAAFATWPSLGARLHPFRGARDSRQLGDPRGMPFVRDMVASAFGSGPEDIVVISNNDIRFGGGLGEQIQKSCREFGCWWSYRINIPSNVTDQGADVFAFTRSWWHVHEHLFPDFLLGYWWWDDIMVRLMRWSGCSERPRNYFHQEHPGVLVRLNTPGHHHNVRLAEAWLREHEEDREKP